MGSQSSVLGSQSSVAGTRPHCNGKDVGSNPAAIRNVKRTLGDSLHGRWPNGPTGSEWKTGDVKPY